MKIVNQTEFTNNYINNYYSTNKTYKGLPLYAKSYKGLERIGIIIKAFLESIPLLTLFSKEVREDWNAALYGKKIVAVIVEEDKNISKKFSETVLPKDKLSKTEKPKKEVEVEGVREEEVKEEEVKEKEEIKEEEDIKEDEEIEEEEEVKEEEVKEEKEIEVDEEFKGKLEPEAKIADNETYKDYYLRFTAKKFERSDHTKLLEEISEREPFHSSLKIIEELSFDECQSLQTILTLINDDLQKLQKQKLDLNRKGGEKELLAAQKASLFIDNESYSIMFKTDIGIEFWQIYLKDSILNEKIPQQLLNDLTIGFLQKKAKIKIAYPKILDYEELNKNYPKIPLKIDRMSDHVLNQVVEVLF